MKSNGIRRGGNVPRIRHMKNSHKILVVKIRREIQLRKKTDIDGGTVFYKTRYKGVD
jgi:hypothetical protein